MTEEIQGLRRWSAEDLMGWYRRSDNPEGYYYSCQTGYREGKVRNWTPDSRCTGQIWLVVERMRELGWSFSVFFVKPDQKYVAEFYREPCQSTFVFPQPNGPNYGWGSNSNPCHAILLSAHIAWSAGREGK